MSFLLSVTYISTYPLVLEEPHSFLPHCHRTNPAAHFVFPRPHHMPATHMRGVRQIFTRHGAAFDVCTLTRWALLELLRPLTPAGIPTVKLRAHGIL